MNQSIPVAPAWFAKEEVEDGVVRIWEPYVDPSLRANSYLVRGSKSHLLIDSGCGISSLRDYLEEAGELSAPITAVATHAHYDHIGSLHEFAVRGLHPIEEVDLLQPGEPAVLRATDVPADIRAALAESGYCLPDLFISALPHQSYEPAAYDVTRLPATFHLVDGDRIDLGGRVLDVLWLPGHAAGHVGLFDRQSKVFFAGDAIYDGEPLIDQGIPGTDIGHYLRTMRRILSIDARAVHAGHGQSFGPERMRAIANEYIASRDGRAS